jgi:hypothetical protein
MTLGLTALREGNMQRVQRQGLGRRLLCSGPAVR